MDPSSEESTFSASPLLIERPGSLTAHPAIIEKGLLPRLWDEPGRPAQSMYSQQRSSGNIARYIRGQPPACLPESNIHCTLQQQSAREGILYTENVGSVWHEEVPSVRATTLGT